MSRKVVNFVFMNFDFKELIKGKICKESPTPPPELYKSTRLIIVIVFKI